MTIEMKKTYRTVSGCDVIIYKIHDEDQARPVHGAIWLDGHWMVSDWSRSGRRMADESPYDLVEVKPRIKRTVWINIYPQTATGYPSKETADFEADQDRIACVCKEIDCEEGEGL